jgi:hypothetical protein
MPIEPGIQLNKEEIFKRITEEQIFEKYLQLPVEEGETYHNPLRADNKAGCRYYRAKNGRIYFKDFSKGYHWDCFNVVQYIYNCSFIEACRIIVRDFRLNNTPALHEWNLQEVQKRRINIQISAREWTIQDAEYWNQYHISLSTLTRFRVYPCKAFWINGEYYRCKTKDPCYAYYFGNKLFKLYFPFRKENRFFQNIHQEDNLLQGYNQLTKSSDLLIITKSYKDVMSYYELDVEAVAPISETQIITKEQYEEFSNIYPYCITNGDNDYRGRIFMLDHFRNYKLPYCVFPKTWGKDLSDNIKLFGFDKIKEILTNFREHEGF